jgi:uncharacterized protein YdhG (YjbR/CyaY superfamily)
MPNPAKTPKEYLDGLPDDRKAALRALRAAVNKGLPKGYKEGMQYGMIGWFVPHSRYPDGYHCDPKQPVPFASIASQKNHMGLYLFCIYTDPKESDRFVKAWKKTGKKLDMGKSCIRFKKIEDVPLELVTETVSRIPVDAFLAEYEKHIPASKRKKAGAPKKKAAAPKKSAAKKKAAPKKKAAAKR